MSKSFTMVFYQIQNQRQDFYHDKLDTQSDSDTQQDEQPKYQYPNAFILSQPVEKVTLKLFKERFPWKIIQKLQKVQKKNWSVQFKIKDINDKINDINVWISLNNQNQNVPIYSGNNIVFARIRKL